MTASAGQDDEQPSVQPTVPFARDRLYQNLAEVEGLFAELRYIDRALAFLDQEQASWWHDLTHGTVPLQVDFGTTAPFSRTYTVPNNFFDVHIGVWGNSKLDALNEQLATMADEARRWSSDNLRDLEQRIAPLVAGEPAAYRHDIVAPLEHVQFQLDARVGEDFAGLRQHIGNWEGSAADNFTTYFYNRFTDIRENQLRMIVALIRGVESARVITEATQHSVMTVVHYLGEALRAELRLRAGQAEQERQENLRNLLIIGGATLGVAGAFFGGLWPGMIAAASHGVATGATISASPSEIMDRFGSSHELSGGTAEAILDSFIDLLGEISRNRTQLHSVLELEIRDTLGEADELRETNFLTPIRPKIADGTDASDFRLH